MLTDHRRDDAGFTLVELLVSITILAVVMGSIAGVFLGVLKANQDTAGRLDATRSEQFVALRFAEDVQGMRATGGLVTSGSRACGTGPFVAEFRGRSYDPAAVTTARVTASVYVVEATTTATGAPATRLRRLTCEAAAGAATPWTPVSDEIVTDFLAPGAPAAPTGSGSQVSWTLTRLDGTTFTVTGSRRTS